MAKMFRMGPIKKICKDAVCIIDQEDSRDQNLNAIEDCFRRRKTDKCELMICVMDSSWNELRPTIKLKGTVDYGI